MRLLIIGSLAGQIGAASRIAINRGAKVLRAEDLGSALQSLRAAPRMSCSWTSRWTSPA